MQFFCDSRRPGRDPKSIPSLTSGDRRSGYRSSAGKTRNEFVRMGDWAETAQIEKEGAAFSGKKDAASF